MARSPRAACAGKGFDAGIPVLCVGNYHVGGAGKTPTVLALAKILRALGETPVVLSRGYGGRLRGPVMVDPARHLAGDVGDEPLMMSQDVPVAVARDRIDGVALAKSQRASVILMDDGFQNPSVAKDASLIVIDSERGLGNGRVLPAGPLRAPLKPQLARTDALVVVGDGGASAEVAGAVAARGGQVFAAQLKPDETSVAALEGQAAARLCRDRRSRPLLPHAARVRARCRARARLRRSPCVFGKRSRCAAGGCARAIN